MYYTVKCKLIYRIVNDLNVNNKYDYDWKIFENIQRQVSEYINSIV